MNDNDLIRVFLPIITNGLAANGFNGVVVQQANQPTQQGVPTAPTVTFFKVMDHRLGYPRKYDSYDGNSMIHTESQVYETMFQVNTLVLQKPSVTNSYTASDLCNAVAAILQSDSTLQIFAQNNIGIYRITDVNNPYFVDDRDNFEASPFFSFTLTHTQETTTVIPVVNSCEPEIYRV